MATSVGEVITGGEADYLRLLTRTMGKMELQPDATIKFPYGHGEAALYRNFPVMDRTRRTVVDRVVAKFFGTGEQWDVSVLSREGKLMLNHLVMKVAFETSPPALRESSPSAAVATCMFIGQPPDSQREHQVLSIYDELNKNLNRAE